MGGIAGKTKSPRILDPSFEKRVLEFTFFIKYSFEIYLYILLSINGRVYRQYGRVYRQYGRIRRQLDAFVDNFWKN